MEKTLSESISRLCSKCGKSSGLALAPILSVAVGCSTYVRVDAPNAEAPTARGADDPTFCVVECVLEMHSPFPSVVVPGERRGVSSQKIDNLHPALQAVSPEWFSTGADAVPVCVKIRADVTDRASWTGIPFDLRTSLMLAPGDWSFAKPVAAKRVDTLGTTFTIAGDLKEAEGPGGADPHFAKILANEIVKAWQELTTGEKRSVKQNPFARRRKAELFAETDASASPSNTGVSVAAAYSKTSDSAQTPPKLTGFGYTKESKRGFVEFAKNGMEHLAALKWARENAIPKIAGKNAFIKIISETTLPGGTSRIDFEVAQ